jgi:hypothetical protein
MKEDVGARTMQEDRGRELGTIILWLGIGIAVAGLLMFTYHVLTCPCYVTAGDERVSCICGYKEEMLITVTGIVVALIGFLTRYRNRRKVASEKRP